MPGFRIERFTYVTFDGDETMFNNLDQQIADDEAKDLTQTTRVIHYLVVAVVSVVVFGGLFWGLWLLEY